MFMDGVDLEEIYMLMEILLSAWESSKFWKVASAWYEESGWATANEVVVVHGVKKSTCGRLVICMLSKSIKSYLFLCQNSC